MNGCTRIAPLLELYADHEGSAETNALVLNHVEQCEDCARELRAIVATRAQWRQALGTERAAPALRARVLAGIDRGQPRRWTAALRVWLAPASAAAIAVAAVTIWLARAPVLDAHVDDAVAEHVACALHGRGPRVTDATAAERGLSTAMPWIRSGADGLRVIEAHTCGGGQPFSHVVLDAGGSTASILIAARADAATLDVPASALARGGFEVSVVKGSRHIAYVIVDAPAGERLQARGGAARQRVERFLRELEDTP